MQAIELFDKENKSILREGWFTSVSKKHQVELEQGERIVGIASFNNPYTACHAAF